MRSRISIECDDPRRRVALHSLPEKAFGCGNVAMFADVLGSRPGIFKSLR